MRPSQAVPPIMCRCGIDVDLSETELYGIRICVVYGDDSTTEWNNIAYVSSDKMRTIHAICLSGVIL